MVAQRTLTPYVRVQILLPLPNEKPCNLNDYKVFSCPFSDNLPKRNIMRSRQKQRARINPHLLLSNRVLFFFGGFGAACSFETLRKCAFAPIIFLISTSGMLCMVLRCIEPDQCLSYHICSVADTDDRQEFDPEIHVQSSLCFSFNTVRLSQELSVNTD